jgi:hypothetical protein
MWDSFCARPAEVAPRGGGANGEGAGGGPGGPESANVIKIFEIIGIKPPAGGRGGRGGGGGGRGGGGSLVGTGDYLVTMTVGGHSYRQTLHVERITGGSDVQQGIGGKEDKGDPHLR